MPEKDFSARSSQHSLSIIQSQYKTKMKDVLHEENSTAKRNGQGTAQIFSHKKSLENSVINIVHCTWLCTLKSIISAMFVNLDLNVNEELPI